MPKHVMMWWIAGGSAVVSATITYVMMRRMARYAPAQSGRNARRTGGRDWKAVWKDGMLRARAAASHAMAAVRARVRTAPAQDETSNGAAAPRHSAFDDYRTSVLRRLDDDERAFHDFLTRLRLAKDREEFDRFMAVHRGDADRSARDGVL